MKGEKLYELLDHLDDNLVLESAEIKRATWRRRLAVLLSVIAVIFVVWLVTTDAARNPRQDVGGQTGALQDGVYYVYAGSGMPLPTESRVPQGLVRYTPGQGKQLLVAYDDHPMDPLLPAWGVNRHGLYFVDTGDPAAPKLFRKDLATGEETLLFTAHPRPTDRRDVHRQQSFRELFLEGGLLEDLYDPALFLDQVGEDTLTLTYRYPDGATSDTLVLDSRTGEELSRTRDPEDRWRAYAGDRAIDVIPRTQDPEAVPRLVDLQENGTSLLPPRGRGGGARPGLLGGAAGLVHRPGDGGLPPPHPRRGNLRPPRRAGGGGADLPGRRPGVGVLPGHRLPGAGARGGPPPAGPPGPEPGHRGGSPRGRRGALHRHGHRWGLVLPHQRRHHRLLFPHHR